MPLHLEQRLLLQMAPDYDKLPLLQKVEVRRKKKGKKREEGVLSA